MTAAIPLALTLITLAALCSIIMMLRNRGGWAGVAVAGGLILAGGGLLLSMWLLDERRSTVHYVAATALDDTWGRTEVAIDARSRITSVEWPRLPQGDDELLDKLRLGVRLEDGKLVVGGFAALKEPAAAAQPDRSAPPAAPRLSKIDRKKLDESLRDTVELAVAHKLDEFFGKLTEMREVEPELTPLRAALKPLDVVQRRNLALQLARHKDTRTRDMALCGVQNVELPELHGIELALCPEGIGTLAETTFADRLRSTRNWPLPNHLSLLIAISVLIVATFVLKVATRRHTGAGAK